MLRRVLKVVVPTGAGGGVVCTTMYLTNASDIQLGSLEAMNLEKRPEVPEKDLKPTFPPQRQPPQKKEPSSSPGQGEDTGDQKDQKKDDQPDSSTQQSSDSSSSSQVMEQQEEDIIKNLIQEIRTKQPIWISGGTSLVKTYEVLSRINNLKMVLEQKYKKKPQAQPTDPSASQAQNSAPSQPAAPDTGQAST